MPKPAPSLSESYERAQAIAASSERLKQIKAGGKLVYADLQVKHASEWLDLDRAHDVLRLHVEAGRYDEADVLAKDVRTALVFELVRLIANGTIEDDDEDQDDDEGAFTDLRPAVDLDDPAPWGLVL